METDLSLTFDCMILQNDYDFSSREWFHLHALSFSLYRNAIPFEKMIRHKSVLWFKRQYPGIYYIAQHSNNSDENDGFIMLQFESNDEKIRWQLTHL